MAEDKSKDYSATLNLPVTEFPMRANLSKREPGVLSTWENSSLYEKILAKRKGAKTFILADGPPYANGNIHIGHAVNKVLKDIIVKSKSMSGYYTPYVPGWDCHGLPIELNVEKKKGKAGHKISPEDFRVACRDYANKQIDIQRESFKRLGILGDWSNPYKTMDFRFEADIIRSIAKIIKAGHLEKGEKPVHWCIDCGSALAEAEVEYKDKESHSIDVKFTLDEESLSGFYKAFSINKEVLSELPNFIIWTTTPWTLPANQAVCLHSELEYSLLKVSLGEVDTYLVLASDLVTSCLSRYLDKAQEEVVDSFEVLGTCLGSSLEGLNLSHPLQERLVPVVLGEHVTTESGTGLVHTAPAHGLDDFVIGKKYNLPLENPVLGNGCYVSSTPSYAGMFITKANKQIIEDLESSNKLIVEKKLLHSYPHCWRHKTPLIFRATTQWFISMDKKGLRSKALDAIEKVSWYPQWGQERIKGMIEGRPDWCISRQRYWGVPIPLVIHKETNEPHPKSEEIVLEIAKKVEEQGIDAWYSLELKDYISDHEQYEKINDVLDVWFDSGVVHEAVLKAREELSYPADLYLEGSDQHRGWFQSSLLSAVAMNGDAPYKQVLTHGFTVDENGRKMSKSLGNVISPEKVINNYGADILRLWISSTEYRSEIAVSDEILKRASDTYRRIRNTARFLLANLHDFDPNTDIVPFDKMLELDKWIIAKADKFQQIFISAYDEYNFHSVYQGLHRFCSIDMGGFYLDVIKDRQYTLPKAHIARKSCQTALYYIAHALARWMSPILSFTAEEIYQHIPGKKEESIFLNTWSEDLTKVNLSEADYTYWHLVLEVRDKVNKAFEEARAKMELGSALDANITLVVGSNLYEQLDKISSELKFIFIASDVKLEKNEELQEDLVKELDSIKILIQANEHDKCGRCWHKVSDVGQSIEHPTLCSRCITNIDGKGEERLYA